MSFSSKQYSYCDISIAFGGRIIEGIVSFEYTEKQEKDFLYGRGCKPHGIVKGNRTFEGKLGLWQSEVEGMTRDAKNKDILSLEFDVIYSYVPKDGGQAVTDIAKNVQATEVKKGMNQGDKNMIIELPVIFTDLQRQK